MTGWTFACTALLAAAVVFGVVSQTRNESRSDHWRGLLIAYSAGAIVVLVALIIAVTT